MPSIPLDHPPRKRRLWVSYAIVAAMVAAYLVCCALAGCSPPPEPPPLPPAVDTLARFIGAVEQAKGLPACELQVDVAVSPEGGISLHCERPVLPVARARVPKGEM